MRDKISPYNQKSVEELSYGELNADRNSRRPSIKRQLIMKSWGSNLIQNELYG